MPRATNRQGFTLIELLVVVVIIGILASVGVAGYAAAMDRARNGGVVSNVRSILMGIEQWKTDHPGLPKELTGANHNEGIAAAAGASLDDFPVKYVPGGKLPLSPWSKKPQEAFQDEFSAKIGNTFDPAADVSNPYAQDVSNGEQLKLSKDEATGAQIFSDGYAAGDGAPPPPNQPPSVRKHYGYVYYFGDSGSTRYAVLGVGKNKSRADVTTLKTNYQ